MLGGVRVCGVQRCGAEVEFRGGVPRRGAEVGCRVQGTGCRSGVQGAKVGCVCVVDDMVVGHMGEM